MCVKNEDPVEHRKEVWRAIRWIRIAINATDADLKVDDFPPGLIVYDDERARYCDGRTPSQQLGEISGRKLIFIPFFEEVP